MDTGLYALKAAFKKVHKVAEATGKFTGNKIADVVAKANDDKIMKTKSVEEIIIMTEEREHYKISKLLNDSSL